MNPSQLFSEEETKDTTDTAILDSDTKIVRMSKRFAKSTILPGDSTSIMIAYQKGASDMKNLVIDALCKDCPSKYECTETGAFDECTTYEIINNLFSK